MNKHISIRVIIALSGVLAFSAVAYGQDQYQAEVSALYSHTSDGLKTDDYGLKGEFFFSPVKTDNLPYAEAAFLNRIGSGFLTGGRRTVKDGGSDNGSFYGAGVNYAQPGFPLRIEGSYTRTKVGPTDNTFNIRAGNYFTDNLLAGVEYNRGRTDPTISSPAEKNTGYGLFAKYVGEIMGRYIRLQGSVGTAKQEQGGPTLKNTNIAVSGDYFFDRNLSAGIGIGNSSGDRKDIEGMTYSVNAQYFITPRYSVKVSYDTLRNSNSGFKDIKTFGAVAAARF